MKEAVHKSINRKKKIIIKAKTLEYIKDILVIALGSYLVTIGINLFLLPNKITTGGASGIATVLYYILNIPMGVTVMLLNIPLFVIAILKLGKEFTSKTIIGTVLLSAFLEIFKCQSIVDKLNLDMVTSSVFGGMIVGAGLALVFNAGASTGGSDLLAQIIYKLTNMQSLSQLLLVIELVIITATMYVFKDFNVGLYSIIAMYISTKVIDVMFEGIYYTKIATIITSKPDKIVKGILNDIKRGATLTSTVGAHSNAENTTITCIVTRPQVAKLKQIVMENDKRAIMYFSSANEVIGRGFKNLE